MDYFSSFELLYNSFPMAFVETLYPKENILNKERDQVRLDPMLRYWALPIWGIIYIFPESIKSDLGEKISDIKALSAAAISVNELADIGYPSLRQANNAHPERKASLLGLHSTLHKDYNSALGEMEKIFDDPERFHLVKGFLDDFLLLSGKAPEFSQTPDKIQRFLELDTQITILAYCAAFDPQIISRIGIDPTVTCHNGEDLVKKYEILEFTEDTSNETSSPERVKFLGLSAILMAAKVDDDCEGHDSVDFYTGVPSFVMQARLEGAEGEGIEEKLEEYKNTYFKLAKSNNIPTWFARTVVEAGHVSGMVKDLVSKNGISPTDYLNSYDEFVGNTKIPTNNLRHKLDKIGALQRLMGPSWPKKQT